MIDIYSKVFKALSDSTRVKIIKYLLTKKEISCHYLMKKFNLSQPTLSYHFNKLIEANIIDVRKDTNKNYYRINKKFFEELGINIYRLSSKVK